MSLVDPEQRCAKLRWKSHGHDVSDPARLLVVLNRSEATFSCLATAQPFGPDDGPAAPERCSDPDRACHKPLRSASRSIV